jgi:hypothetical protein
LNNKTIRRDPKFLVSIAVIATVAIFAIGSTATSAISQTQNDTAQFIQLKKYAALLGGTGAITSNPILGISLNSVDDYKQWLSTSVAVNEGYTNDPNPAKYAASNQTLADLDTKITSYLCSIDQTYCENGPNAPVRIVRNAG